MRRFRENSDRRDTSGRRDWSSCSSSRAMVVPSWKPNMPKVPESLCAVLSAAVRRSSERLPAARAATAASSCARRSRMIGWFFCHRSAKSFCVLSSVLSAMESRMSCLVLPAKDGCDLLREGQWIERLDENRGDA